MMNKTSYSRQKKNVSIHTTAQTHPVAPLQAITLSRQAGNGKILLPYQPHSISRDPLIQGPQVFLFQFDSPIAIETVG